jgi:hypothetical protein
MTSSCAQKQSFGLASFTPPKGWKKTTTEAGMQFSIEDAQKGGFCVITIYKDIPSGGGSKENFDAAWETVLKEMITVTAAPEMQPVQNEDGWEIQTGYSPFESDGVNGMAFLVTGSGYEKMVNLVIITNTDVYEKNITDFLESITLKKPAATKIAGDKSPKPETKPVNASNKPSSTGFPFNKTKFDDGWTSTVQ